MPEISPPRERLPNGHVNTCGYLPDVQNTLLEIQARFRDLATLVVDAYNDMRRCQLMLTRQMEAQRV